MEQSNASMLGEPDKPKAGRRLALVIAIVVVVLILIFAALFFWPRLQHQSHEHQETQQEMIDSLNASGTEAPLSQQTVGSLTASLNENATTSPLSTASTSELLKSLSQ